MYILYLTAKQTKAKQKTWSNKMKDGKVVVNRKFVKLGKLAVRWSLEWQDTQYKARAMQALSNKTELEIVGRKIHELIVDDNFTRSDVIEAFKLLD